MSKYVTFACTANETKYKQEKRDMEDVVLCLIKNKNAHSDSRETQFKAGGRESYKFNPHYLTLQS